MPQYTNDTYTFCMAWLSGYLFRKPRSTEQILRDSPFPRSVTLAMLEQVAEEIVDWTLDPRFRKAETWVITVEEPKPRTKQHAARLRRMAAKKP